MSTLRLIIESFRFAGGALRENLLRTLLSLLGVTIGIFSIIGVLTLVDTLESSIKQSFNFLRSDVIYVQKWPWVMAPDYPWWKYVNRPEPSYKEFEFLEHNATVSEAVAMYGMRQNLTVRYQSNSIGSVLAMGVSYHYDQVSDVRVEEGRYFSMQEVERGKHVTLIGEKIATQLFGDTYPIGKIIKIKNQPFTVIGVMKRQGENLFGASSADEMCIIPYHTLARMFATRRGGINPSIALKARPDDVEMTELENEIRGLMRVRRGLKPLQEDTFAMNRAALVASFIDNIIAILSIAGAIIGGFALLIGGFGIANIMFVSVKERTNLIGIQKSLGAQNSFILLQFLFEALFLSIIGGMAGLILVSVLSLLSTEGFVITLTLKNITVGLVVSSVLGILAGIIPAYVASRLDPVIAIRSK